MRGEKERGYNVLLGRFDPRTKLQNFTFEFLRGCFSVFSFERRSIYSYLMFSIEKSFDF